MRELLYKLFPTLRLGFAEELSTGAPIPPPTEPEPTPPVKPVVEPVAPVVPVVEPAAAPELSGEEMMRAAKQGLEVPPAEVPPVVEPLVVAPEPPIVTPTEPPKPTKEEIEARVAAFMGQPKADPTQYMPRQLMQRPTETLEQHIGLYHETQDPTHLVTAVRQAKVEGQQEALNMLMQTSGQYNWDQGRHQANKQVYMKHPELLAFDKNSSKNNPTALAKEMQKVYAEAPHLLNTEANGPLYAMEVAESRLAARGINPATEVDKATGLAITQAPLAPAPIAPSAVPPVASIPPIAQVPQKSVAELQAEATAKEKARQDQARAAALVASSGVIQAPPAAGVPNLGDAARVIAGKMGLTDVEYANYMKQGPIHNKAYYDKYRYAHLSPRGGAK